MHLFSQVSIQYQQPATSTHSLFQVFLRLQISTCSGYMWKLGNPSACAAETDLGINSSLMEPILRFAILTPHSAVHNVLLTGCCCLRTRAAK